MDTLLEEFPNSMNNFIFDQNSIPSFPDHHNPPDQFEANHELTNLSLVPEYSDPYSDSSPSSSGMSSEGVNSPDDSNAILGFISQMLMEEEDLENKPCMLQDCLALRAAEKSLYDVLVQEDSSSSGQNLSSTNQNVGSPDDVSNHSSDSSHAASNWFDSDFDCVPQVLDTVVPNGKGGVTDLEGNSSFPADARQLSDDVNFSLDKDESESRNGSRGKKNRYREDGDYVDEERSYKQSAVYADEIEPEEMFDQVLLCQGHKSSPTPQVSELKDGNGKLQRTGKAKGSKAKKTGKKKPDDNKEMVDLRTLLTQCAQAVASYDKRNATEQLKLIRQHSSPYGDGTQRLAHYVSNGLEERLTAAVSSYKQSVCFSRGNLSAAAILKAYQTYITACPFKKMSNYYANQTIRKLAEKRTRLHIIDFGILYGYQWPCLIQVLSKRLGGPPMVRFTGIEFPQSGFRPSEGLEETGRRLQNYCKRVNVPFEYTAIAKNWETIQYEDIKIDRDEVTVVNCLYRLKNLPDDVVLDSPRDTVLKLIRRINPDVFIQGIVNGTYNAPFFDTRFREALYHFSSLFDMFDETLLREDQQRLLFEQEIFGKDLINAIACEGSMRLERPETYKQWQMRNKRAGFKELPIDQDILKKVRTMVKSDYHKDFVVDEDGQWVLHGWKGRIINAISCWKPA
ncbi:scarecrow-like protein 11 [Argentina anserina]|uniref:scarecrow-like protein 11 n=1 Tax=Argentina anserina TaxID=57926 RepID=UPI0021768953|nr:scarecrow-like protein 11 [Potentilla anserina]